MTVRQDDPYAGVREFVLQKHRLVRARVLDPQYVGKNRGLPNGVSVRVYERYLNEVVMEVETYVWGTHKRHVVARRPATWWDHFKAVKRPREGFLGWWLRLLTTPPKMQDVEIDVRAWLPDLSLTYDGEHCKIVNFDASIVERTP